jgi:hypothetical protein
MNIVAIVIEVLIFTALIGTIATQVASGGNLSGASLVLYGLITVVIVAGFIMYLYKTTGLGNKMHK